MENPVTESSYPITFRENDAKILGQHLKNRHSVVVIGMKRVGISNFLRFFLNHKAITQTYIADNKKHLFIPVDLNDLVEREIFPFWILTLKRIADAVEKSDLSNNVKKFIAMRFLDCIQSKNLFYLIDSIRESLIAITNEDTLPTIFFLRFDRMANAATHEFFANIQGLQEATNRQLSYVFTSVRDLATLSENVFQRSALSLFAYDMYLKPSSDTDVRTIIAAYKQKYAITLTKESEQSLLSFLGGYNQYLQLALILLHEQGNISQTTNELAKLVFYDERVMLQSEELWESLTTTEKQAIHKIITGQELTEAERLENKYIFDTGIVSDSKTIFSPLFKLFLERHEEQKPSITTIEMSKKENLLFSYLKSHTNQICEREDIINAVWPEEEALGVSDWAIDRLISRVRGKLKAQKSEFEIQTIRTRGYKLLSKSS